MSVEDDAVSAEPSAGEMGEVGTYLANLDATAAERQSSLVIEIEYLVEDARQVVERLRANPELAQELVLGLSSVMQRIDHASGAQVAARASVREAGLYFRLEFAEAPHDG